MDGARLISLADFQDPDLVAAMQELIRFQAGGIDVARVPQVPLDGGTWSAATALLAARRFLVRTPAARVLVLGDGFGCLPFFLAQNGHLVQWGNTFAVRAGTHLSSLEGLMNPALVLPDFSARQHISVQHADARHLPYVNESFDLVLAAGWLERLERDDDVKQATFEIGRVLAPGGEVVVGLPFEVVGPPPEMEHSGVRFRDAATLRTLLLSDSGLAGDLSDDDLSLDESVAERRSDLLGILAHPGEHDWGVRLDMTGADLLRSARGFTHAPLVLHLSAGLRLPMPPPLRDAGALALQADRDRVVDLLRDAHRRPQIADTEAAATPPDDPSAALQMRRTLTVTQEAARFHRSTTRGLRRFAFATVEAGASVGLRALNAAEVYGTRLMS